MTIECFKHFGFEVVTRQQASQPAIQPVGRSHLGRKKSDEIKGDDASQMYHQSIPPSDYLILKQIDTES